MSAKDAGLCVMSSMLNNRSTACCCSASGMSAPSQRRSGGGGAGAGGHPAAVGAAQPGGSGGARARRNSGNSIVKCNLRSNKKQWISSSDTNSHNRVLMVFLWPARARQRGRRARPAPGAIRTGPAGCRGLGPRRRPRRSAPRSVSAALRALRASLYHIARRGHAVSRSPVLPKPMVGSLASAGSTGIQYGPNLHLDT